MFIVNLQLGLIEWYIFAAKEGNVFLMSVDHNWEMVSVDAVLPTVPDCRFGSQSRLKPKHCQICILGCQLTRTANSDMARQKSPIPSELGGLVGRPVGPSVDSYNDFVFTVW